MPPKISDNEVPTESQGATVASGREQHPGLAAGGDDENHMLGGCEAGTGVFMNDPVEDWEGWAFDFASQADPDPNTVTEEHKSDTTSNMRGGQLSLTVGKDKGVYSGFRVQASSSDEEDEGWDVKEDDEECGDTLGVVCEADDELAGLLCEVNWAGDGTKGRGQQLRLVGGAQGGQEGVKGAQPLNTTTQPTYAAITHHPGTAEARCNVEERGDSLMVGNLDSTVAKMRGQLPKLAAGVGGELSDNTTNQPTYDPDLQPQGKGEGEAVPGASGGGGNKGVACVHDARGVCSEHGQAKKLFKPNKRVWAKGKNGLYGWKYSRMTYYECRTVTQAEHDVP